MLDRDVALTAARAGAAVVRDRFGRSRQARYKGTYDPVTETDVASEKAILEVLHDLRPHDAILAEESGGTPSGRTWIVDPIDGTVNFMHGIPHVSVSVALWDGDDPVVGVVLDPLRDETFVAINGEGATMNGAPITVSPVASLAEAVVGTGFPYDHDVHAAAYAANLGAVLERVNGIRRMGSAALDLAWVANGRFDAYWELHVEAWDEAAGIVLVREAGGMVTDLRGENCPPRPGPVVAAPPHLFPEFLALATRELPPHLRGDEA